MATGAALLVIGTLIAGEPLVLPQRAATWLAISYLVVIGSILVFVLYVVVVRLWGASRAAYGLVLTPVVTVLISRWLDNEPITARLVLGGLLVLAGVYIGALRPAHAARAVSASSAAPEAASPEG
jgi:drug/metabolite transporter (DMT)-like permease